MTKGQKHVAAFVFPFAGHVTTLVSLVRRMAAEAPDIRFSFFGTAASNASPSSSERNSNVTYYDIPDGLPEGFVFERNPPLGVDYFMKAAPLNLRAAVEAAEVQVGAKISCLITDAFLWFAADIAEERHIPWVTLWVSAARLLLAHLLTDLIRDKVAISGKDDTTLDFIPGFSNIRVADLPEEVVYGDLEFGIAATVYKMGQELPRATATVINTPEELEAISIDQLRSRLKNCLPLGPIPMISPSPFSDEHGCLPWLDKHPPASVAYISFGVFLTPPPNEVAAMAAALEERGVPFLWSFRGNAKEKLPEGFMERTNNQGKIVPWAPQLQVLQHPSIGVFVTHSGWNSVLDSMVGGVPLICRPFFGDHTLNVRAIDAIWGIGVPLDGGTITKGGVLKGLELILSTDKGKNIRQKVGTLKELTLNSLKSSGSFTRHFKTLLEIIANQ